MLACAPATQPTPSTPQRVAHIGFLSSSVSSESSPQLEALRAQLRELGYDPGRNIEIDYKFAASAEALPALAMQLVDRRVDVILAGGSEAIAAALNATKTIPIIMTNSGDPVRDRFVSSLAKPGGNVTGLTQISPTLAPKRVDVLLQAFPGRTRVAVVWNPNHPNTPDTFAQTRTALDTLRLPFVDVQVRDPNEFESGFTRIITEKADALILLRDPFMVRNRQSVINFAALQRLPAIYESADFVESGGLMAYGPNLIDLYRRSARYVDRVLKGTSPADLPVEAATQFELVLNRRAAQAMGVTFPQLILAQADKVID